MSFNRSLVQRLRYQPFKTDADGNVTQTLDGVFILLSRELVDMLKENLSDTVKAQLESYVYPVTAEQAGLWHVPVWAGEDHAVYLRVPATLWSDPTTDPPAKVKAIFQKLWQDATDA